MHPKRCSYSTWKCSLLMGSVLCWMLGIIVFGLSLSTIRKPVFHPSLMPVVEPIYQSMTVAFAGGIFICIVAFLGCCGVSCRSPWILMLYGLGLIILFIYQVVDGISLVYQTTETFPSLQFLSVELCEYRRRMGGNRNSRHLSDEDVIESVTKAEETARRFNHDVALLLKVHRDQGMSTECLPINDMLTPTAALLFISALFYIYLGYCAVCLCLHLLAGQDGQILTQNVKFQMEGIDNETGPTIEEELTEDSASLRQVQIQPGKGSPDSVGLQRRPFSPARSPLLTGPETKTTVVQMDRIVSEKGSSPARARPKSPARPPPPLFTSPLNSSLKTPQKLVSCEQHCSTIPVSNFLPAIVILSPTPDRKCSDS